MESQNNTLHYETVTPLLLGILRQLMREPLFDPFVLVGGTNLSLRLGHRKSDDIDLFTDAAYDSLDFGALESYLKKHFAYFEKPDKSGIVGFGQGYYIGSSSDSCVKLDLMYTDSFFSPFDVIDGLRLASTEQIAAMKMHAIATGGRKKDWWDIYELLKIYNLERLLDYHEKWQPWTFSENEDIERLTDFSKSNKQANPISLNGTDWDEVKLRIIDAVRFLNV